MNGPQDTPPDMKAASKAEKASRKRWLAWRHRILLLFVAIGLIFAAALAWLDSGPGHRFVVQRIANLAPESGLKISIGRIDGSIYDASVLHDVQLSDPEGVFFSSPGIALDWWPWSWLTNRLSIDALLIPQAKLHRMPRLRPSKESDGKILPDFDIRIMQLRVGQLEVDKAVMGRADIFSITGDADIRSGRAIIDLNARAMRGADKFVLALDSRPDKNRFDIDLTINAPAGGLISALSGIKQNSVLNLDGDGDWKRWDGKLTATIGGKPAADFAVGLREGDYHIEGDIAGSVLGSSGLLARLTEPQLHIVADGRFENKLVSGQFEATSNAIVLSAKGGVHLGGRGYDNLTVDLGLHRPSALLRNFDTRGLVARARFNGPFSTTRFEYLLRADALHFGTTIVRGVHAAGDGRASGKNNTTQIPISLTAQGVDGQGDVVAQLARGFSLKGVLQKNGSQITSGPMQLRSQRVSGALLAQFNLATGRYDLGLSGDIRGLEIAGLGVVNVASRLNAKPDSNGAFRVAGRVNAKMARLDNSFFRTLGGGLPQLQSDVALGADGRLRLDRISLNMPLLRLTGNGAYNPDKTISINGAGAHESYGPFKIKLTEKLERPAVDLILEHPLDAAGLADVHVLLDPDEAGYHFRAEGQSAIGPFTSNGDIIMPSGRQRGGQTSIKVADLSVNGAHGSGVIDNVPNGFAGRIGFLGSAKGPVDFSIKDGIQHMVADMRMEGAHFEGATPIDIRRGLLDAELVLAPEATKLNATLRGSGIQMGKLRINRLAANLTMEGEQGRLRANAIGQRGRAFTLDLDAALSPNDIRFNLGGTLDKYKVALDRRAWLRRIEGGWALDPLSVSYRGGQARIYSAAYGDETRFDIGLQNLSLSLLDLGNVDLGLGGSVNGRVRYAKPRTGVSTGSAAIKVQSLTRSGVTRTSSPMDLGLNAELSANRLAARAVVSQKGTTIGKAQALITPLSGEGGLVDRLRAAPVNAQLRYVGPAEALWRMSTIEIIDLTGPVSLKADVHGTGADPIINGALKTSNAKIESPITGMRIRDLRSSARFDGSRLIFSHIDGTTEGGGTISGSGSFDFSLGEGVGIDMVLEAKRAEMLDRDDIGATVSGPITIKSDGLGGTISGDLDVVRSRFRLGRAAEIAEIPELQLIERNSRRGDFAPVQRGTSWRLDMKARARNRLMVNGMGLASEWSMNLDIGGSVASPMLTGRADLVRGTYDFAGRRFDLTEGRLRFNGNVPADPTLDIIAEAALSDFDATIRIGGTSSAPEITFSSTPVLPQDEVLSRLLFGSSITQLSAPEALQLAAAVGSLQGNGGGLDPINAVRRAAGLDRLRILPANPTTGQNTSIGVGKYVSRKIYVELITDGQGYSATRMEYQVTRWLSLLSSISTLGRQTATLRVSKDY